MVRLYHTKICSLPIGLQGDRSDLGDSGKLIWEVNDTSSLIKLEKSSTFPVNLS
jgi:hypothetical protein